MIAIDFFNLLSKINNNFYCFLRLMLINEKIRMHLGFFDMAEDFSKYNLFCPRQTNKCKITLQNAFL